VLGRTVGRGRDPASVFYALIPPLLMFMIFLGGTHLAIDTTAGERERGSLEPLLTAPVERSTLLVGKASAALAFTVLTVLVHLIAFMLILGAVAHGTSGLRPPPDLAAFATILAIAVPVMVVAVALQFLIATITRSMKEAQIYLGLLPVVPAMPGMVMALTTAHAAKAVAAVPILGQLVAFTDIAVGQAPSWSALALASFGTLAIAAAAFWAATRAFERMRQLSPA
jgi:sodium transport system permease protein